MEEALTNETRTFGGELVLIDPVLPEVGPQTSIGPGEVASLGGALCVSKELIELGNTVVVLLVSVGRGLVVSLASGSGSLGLLLLSLGGSGVVLPSSLVGYFVGV